MIRRTSRRKKRKKWPWLGMLLCITVIFTGVFLWRSPQYLQTEAFIKEHMTNGNGTLATYLTAEESGASEAAKGREALSESMGLWLQYGAEKKDEDLFRQSAASLKAHFIGPEGLVYWKLTAEGKTLVSTNALVDDLRLVDALYSGYSLWGKEEYARMAQSIGQANGKYLAVDGMLVDFYDLKYKNHPDFLTLAYICPSTVQKLVSQGIFTEELGAATENLLATIPNDGIFYPKQYQLKTKKTVYEPVVNLVEQLYIMQHRRQLGLSSDPLYGFLRQEFYSKGVIYGTYDRISRQPPQPFESPAVYGLVILAALEQEDRQFALDVYKKMVSFRVTSGMYKGGYVSAGNTHVFDNLYPLLAEFTMYQTIPFFFLQALLK